MEGSHIHCLLYLASPRWVYLGTCTEEEQLVVILYEEHLFCQWHRPNELPSWAMGRGTSIPTCLLSGYVFMVGHENYPVELAKHFQGEPVVSLT